MTSRESWREAVGTVAETLPPSFQQVPVVGQLPIQNVAPRYLRYLRYPTKYPKTYILR